MSGGRLSLRMLVVALPDLDLWRQAAAAASVPIQFAAYETAADAVPFIQHGVDICIVDSALAQADVASVINAARAVRPAPLIFVVAARGKAAFDGVDGTLARPRSAEEARKLTEICVRTKIPTRVLIVDDSKTMRSIVRKILSASRFAIDVHEASEGIAALSQLRHGKFGLVFLDYSMPGLDGFETLLKIRSEIPDVEVVIMTSAISDALADRARAAGALAYLKKPFYPSDIDAVLERYYGLR